MGDGCGVGVSGVPEGVRQGWGEVCEGGKEGRNDGGREKRIWEMRDDLQHSSFETCYLNHFVGMKLGGKLATSSSILIRATAYIPTLSNGVGGGILSACPGFFEVMIFAF